ncbi:hypothetical protein [Deinococcus misasensis]|uniref:hypothetical protein n=1 Tax=Deinococcus misasensis TaxID=392413 RepID=UPI000AE88727|nr:hypothetical protein [Deinococcus misasensis]
MISSPDQLRSRLAREALQALQGDLGQYWTLIGVMQFENHDLLAMDVTVELPQYPACDLKETERLALWFHHEDQGIPKVCALRSDFPALPHTINMHPGTPLVICLYTTPPEELRAQLTGQQLLARISQWMRRAARGELHEANQPLQAFFHQSAHQMVLPSSIDFSTTSILSMHVMEREAHGVKTTLTGNKGDFGKAGKPALLSLHGLPATEHNTLTRLPATLFDLHQFLQGFGVDLFAPLRQEFCAIIEAGGYLQAR